MIRHKYNLAVVLSLFSIILTSCSKEENWYSSELEEEIEYSYYEDSLASYKLISTKSFVYGEPIESKTIEKTIIIQSANTSIRRVESYDIDEGDTLIMSIVVKECNDDGKLIREYDSSSFGETRTRYEYLDNYVVKELTHRYLYQYDYSSDFRTLLSVDTTISELENIYDEDKITKRIGIHRESGLDRLSATLPPDTIVNSYTYNLFDSLERVISIRNNDTIGLKLNSYDSLKRKVRVVSVYIDIGKDVISYEYDSLNNLKKETWNSTAINEVRLYSYDSHGRIISERVHSIDQIF